MRIIKFRVWDTVKKKFWVQSNGFRFRLENISRRFNNFPLDLSNISNKKRFIIQQFTGLLDKNNKDIYEGDIISSWGGEGIEIKYDNECCGFYPLLEKNNYEYMGEYNQENIEVVGNVFQNPTLITKQ